MTAVEQAIQILKDEFNRRYPGYQEALDRMDRARAGVAAAKEEENSAREELGKYGRDDEYLMMSIRGVEDALRLKP